MHYQKIHENVKIFSSDFSAASNFEMSANIIVITNATNTLAMANAIRNIEEEQQRVDFATVEQIAKIMKFLRDIED